MTNIDVKQNIYNLTNGWVTYTYLFIVYGCIHIYNTDKHRIRN